MLADGQVGDKDRASHILLAPFDSLEPDERFLRYFIRFSNLSGKERLTPPPQALSFVLTQETERACRWRSGATKMRSSFY